MGRFSDWFKKVNNNLKIDHKIGICVAVVLLVCVLFWVGLLADKSLVVEKFDLGITNSLEGELIKAGKEQNYIAVLSDEFEESKSIMFKSSHAKVEVLVGGELVYVFGNTKSVVGKSPGTCWHIVELPENSAGKELLIRRTSVYSSYSGTDAQFYYGSRGDCLLKLVDNFLYVLIMNSISMMMGLICLLLYFRTLKQKDVSVGNGFLWIGLFAFLIALWSLRQCGFLRILIPDSEILYFIDIHTLILAPIPLNMFVRSISKTRWGKACLWFVPIYIFILLFGMLMQVAGVFDIVEMLTALHVFIAINAAYMLWAVHREAWKNKGSAVSRFCIPLYTVLAFGIMEMIHYYMPSRNTSIFLPTGVMVFILLLVWQQVGAYFHMLEQQKLVYYEKFANTDMLTGALNRNAYETKLKTFADVDLNGYAAALFDLNGLKFINDNYGHEKGDEAIKCCYELIVSVFGDKGTCYRIGGDEFVFLGQSEEDVNGKIGYFDSLVAEHQARMDFPFEVALGYALYDGEQDKDIQDTIKRSDAMMYHDKQEKKNRVAEK